MKTTRVTLTLPPGGDALTVDGPDGPITYQPAELAKAADGATTFSEVDPLGILETLRNHAGMVFMPLPIAGPVEIDGRQVEVRSVEIDVSSALKAAQEQARSLLIAADKESNLQALAAQVVAMRPGPLAIAFLALFAREQGRSINASNAAKRKNESMRAWVIERWETREDRAQSKASFAREMHGRVKAEFGETVTAKTIETRWLSKG